MINTYKIRWILPDNTYFENKIGNVTKFLSLLKMVDCIAYDALSYKVVRTELILEDEPWISILLE